MIDRWEHHKQTAAMIRRELESELNPTYLEVIDDSRSHSGHSAAEHEPLKGHFKVTINASVMDSLNKVSQHQLVYKALSGLMPRIHALTISVVE